MLFPHDVETKVKSKDHQNKTFNHFNISSKREYETKNYTHSGAAGHDTRRHTDAKDGSHARPRNAHLGHGVGTTKL